MEVSVQTAREQVKHQASPPLTGYRILDWGAWQAGPAAGMMLGDLGADVIKIENRGSGDPSRGLEPGFDIRYKTARTCYFEIINRNKRGISLDLAKPEGREVLYGLAKKSDAFITNFRPHVVERYGMGYEVLSKINPKLVYAMVTGFGPKGPDADKRSYDSIGQARSGLMRQCDPDGPRYVIGGVGDSVPAFSSRLRRADRPAGPGEDRQGPEDRRFPAVQPDVHSALRAGHGPHRRVPHSPTRPQEPPECPGQRLQVQGRQMDVRLQHGGR